jgi:predicted NBD/HSP70 family sugar kinase
LRRASASHVRDLNRAAVLRLIGREGPIARHEIARRLELSPATVTAVTKALISHGLVRVVDQAPSRGGRRAILLGLVPSAAHAFGVKIAADHVVGVRVDLDAEVLERFEEPFDAGSANAVERLSTLVRRHLPAGGDVLVADPVLLGIGLGVPGVVDTRSGAVDAPTLGWRNVPLVELLENELELPVLVDNDVNTLAIAERLYGLGLDAESFLTVTIGRGVGLGIVVGGDVYRGPHGGAGEFGHVAVADDGPRCPCGNYGCLEAFVADPALVARGRDERLLGEHEGIEELRVLAARGVEQAQAIYSEAGAMLGRAVAGLVNVFAPELVIVSGEGTQAWPQLAAAFDRSLHDAVFAPLKDVEIAVDPWDDAKWARGAAALVLRAAFVPALDERERHRHVRARLAVDGASEAVA